VFTQDVTGKGESPTCPCPKPRGKRALASAPDAFSVSSTV
jgi:hypothetical protein